MNTQKKPFDFKNLDIDSLKYSGGDYLPFDISSSIFERFPGQIKYDKTLTFIFYPKFAKGKIGLIYCYSHKLDTVIGNTYYFGWGTTHNVFSEFEFTTTIGELFLFADNEHTTDSNKAEETMFKYVLLRKYE